MNDEKILSLPLGKRFIGRIASRLKEYIDGLSASDLSAADSLELENNVLTLKSGDQTLDSVSLMTSAFEDSYTLTGDGDFILSDSEIEYVFEHADEYEYDGTSGDSDQLFTQAEMDAIIVQALANNAW